jgi:O-6-methylguanine DNA methyltransferase
MNLILQRCTIPTPIGTMVALASDEALCVLEFDSPVRRGLLEARLRSFYGSPRRVDEDPKSPSPILGATRRWLGEYFEGRFPAIPFPLDARGSAFEQRVWALLQTLPAGTRATYGELAARLGMPAGARAVGGASRRNPISILVPCHRVVGASGDLTGYGGGLDSKRHLLQHEADSVRPAGPGTAGPSLSYLL